MIGHVCRAVWTTSELTGVGLGRLAPWVLGGMVGSRPRKERTDG